MTQAVLLDVSSHVFDRSHPSLQRDRLGAVGDRVRGYDDRYDFATFVYDCFWDSEAREVWLLCPRLLNFRTLLDDMSFAVDGTPHSRIKVENLSRGTAIRLKGLKSAPNEVRFDHPLATGTLRVNAEQFDLFKGTNAVFSINRNNRLEWVQDWLTYYHKVHGGTAAVLTDNASTDYSAQDLLDAMAAVDGMEAVCVIPAPFPFGPNAEGKANTDSLFLQRTMGELCRKRLLGQARAVLSVDIDELFYSRSGQSIFDATVASEAGYIRADAEWVYADPEQFQGPARHRDHGFLSATRNPQGKRIPKANRKWCVDPQGPQKGRQWLTHFLGSQKDPVDPDFTMLHFRQVSTSWKHDRSSSEGIALDPFPELQDLMARTFDD
ncbi:MAG: hypothetical protein AAFO93_11160 [Pseudomonadota bacterium]